MHGASPNAQPDEHAQLITKKRPVNINDALHSRLSGRTWKKNDLIIIENYFDILTLVELEKTQQLKVQYFSFSQVVHAMTILTNLLYSSYMRE